jgi:hypothetical protein
MKIKEVFLIIALLFAVNISYSQNDGIIERMNAEKDSSDINLKLTGGFTLYSAIDPYQDRGDVTFKNGYFFGLILTLSDIFELEGSFTSLKSNSSANNAGLISSFGLRLNLYKSDYTIYYGIGVTHLSSEETRNCGSYGCGPMGDPAIGYTTFYVPVGVSYKLSKKIELDLNSRLSLIVSRFQFDRITYSLGIVFDI